MKVVEDPMRRICNLRKPIFLFALILMTSGLTRIAWADTTGTVAEAITGTTGALVPGATVALQNTATGIIKRVTADRGGRYEFLAVPVTWSDTQNRLQTFIPTEQSTRYSGAPQGWVSAGDPGFPSSIAPTQCSDLAPRLGNAYSPNATEGVLGKIFGGPGKTSIRGGFGIFYTAYAQISNKYELSDSPFAIFYVTTVPVYREQPSTGRRAQDRGQRFPYVAPISGGSVNWATFQSEGGQQAFLTSNVTPYSEQFNSNIQRQLGRL
jgi:hypothetical protein